MKNNMTPILPFIQERIKAGRMSGTLFKVIKLLFTNIGVCDNNELCLDRPD